MQKTWCKRTRPWAKSFGISTKYCLWSDSKYRLFMAFDVNKRHFLFGMYLVSVESLQPVILNAGRVCSQDIGQSGVTHWYKCRNTMLVLNVGPWNVFLKKSWRLTTEFIILLYLSDTKPFTLILLNCKNTDKNYLK